jgi:fatty-acyl-CoA synthase
MDSYLDRSSSFSRLETTLDEFLRQPIRDHAADLALVDDQLGHRWTFADLESSIDEWRSHLKNSGCRRGDRIALLAENGADWVSIFLASVSEGIVVVSLDPALSGQSIRERMRLTGARHLFASGPVLTPVDLPAGFVAYGWVADTSIQRIVANVDPAEPAPQTFPELRDAGTNAACMICFSSGTTGPAKAVTLTHANLLNNMYLIGDLLGYQVGHRVMSLFPFFVAGGTVMGILAVLARGATIVCAPPAPQIVQALNRHRPHYLMASPRLVEQLFEKTHGDLAFLDHLHRIGMGSTPSSPKFINGLMRDRAIRTVFLLYGMTETSPVTFIHAVTEPMAGDVVPMGKLVDGLQAKLVDGNGQNITHDELGELYIRGHATMAGYWNDRAATERMIDADDWLHTGDLVRADADGNWYFVGRKSEQIEHRGRMLHPSVMERVFLRHEDVCIAQVVALSDRRLAAWVKPNPGAVVTPEGLMSYYRVASAGLPSINCIRLVDSFPLNATGKIQRSVIADQMSEGLSPS